MAFIGCGWAGWQIRGWRHHNWLPWLWFLSWTLVSHCFCPPHRQHQSLQSSWKQVCSMLITAQYIVHSMYGMLKANFMIPILGLWYGPESTCIDIQYGCQSWPEGCTLFIYLHICHIQRIHREEAPGQCTVWDFPDNLRRSHGSLQGGDSPPAPQ